MQWPSYLCARLVVPWRGEANLAEAGGHALAGVSAMSPMPSHHRAAAEIFGDSAARCARNRPRQCGGGLAARLTHRHHETAPPSNGIEIRPRGIFGVGATSAACESHRRRGGVAPLSLVAEAEAFIHRVYV